MPAQITSNGEMRETTRVRDEGNFARKWLPLSGSIDAATPYRKLTPPKSTLPHKAVR
jgi:hypothetical protein